VREVKKNMAKENLGTLTIDVSPTAMLRNYLINVDDVSEIVDYVVFMTYDYHYSGSAVTGAVSPVGGMEKDAEFDTETAIKLAKQIMPENKIIIGTPLYGYEWETLEDTPRSAIIPGSGQVISNRRLEEELSECATCSAKLEELSKESYLIYKNEDTGTFQQAFYPDKQATAEKIKLAEKYKAGGIALWALGYEGDTILEPLAEYK
jgi:spore germination protein